VKLEVYQKAKLIHHLTSHRFKLKTVIPYRKYVEFVQEPSYVFEQDLHQVFLKVFQQTLEHTSISVFSYCKIKQHYIIPKRASLCLSTVGFHWENMCGRYHGASSSRTQKV
jgi:hypothetical protein